MYANVNACVRIAYIIPPCIIYKHVYIYICDNNMWKPQPVPFNRRNWQTCLLAVFPELIDQSISNLYGYALW